MKSKLLTNRWRAADRRRWRPRAADRTEAVETEGSGSMEGSGSKEEAKMKVSESAGGNGKTKMVTRRLDKMSIDIILKDHPPFKPFTYTTHNPFIQCMFASDIAQYEVDCEFHEYLRRQSIIRGYAEYQLEVTHDEKLANDHKLV